MIMLCLLGLLPAFGPTIYPFFGSMLFAIIVISLALRIATFDSIYSPNFQIFFSTLGKQIRGRGKIFVEGIIKPFAILSSGILIIVLFSRFIVPSIAILLILSSVLFWRSLLISKI